MKNKRDREFMRMAIKQAKLAQEKGEVPVGAVLVSDDKVIAAAHNRPLNNLDATAHAEILALRQAGQILQNYRLLGTTLYVTLEPCLMCAGALLNARISRLVYAAGEPKSGAIHSKYNFFSSQNIYPSIEVCHGLLEKESAALLQDFFAAKRRAKAAFKKH